MKKRVLRIDTLGEVVADERLLRLALLGLVVLGTIWITAFFYSVTGPRQV